LRLRRFMVLACRPESRDGVGMGLPVVFIKGADREHWRPP
jgi:hypothetical protein